MIEKVPMSVKETDIILNGADWKMGNHIKNEQSTSSLEEMGLEEQFVLSISQMLQEDGEDEHCGESVTRLTGKVRACYFNHLKKILVKNYEMCFERDHCEWPFSRDDVIKCATWLEQKALRSCMVVILYQRAMTRLVAEIKKHTEQLRLYKKLKDFVNLDCGLATKATQMDNHFICANKTCQVDKRFNSTDRTTQTDPVTIVPEHQLNIGTGGADVESRTDILPSTPINECFQPVAIKTENLSQDVVQQNVTEGVPIPVYVSGISSSEVHSTTDHYSPGVNYMEPISFYGTNEELVPNMYMDCLYQCPLSNESYHENNDMEYSINNNGLNEPLTPQPNINEEEPFEWSVIEEQTKLNHLAEERTKLNVEQLVPPAKENTQPRLRVRRLSTLQQNSNLLNGALSEDNSSDLNIDEVPRMSIDERISTVLGNKNSHNVDSELVVLTSDEIAESSEPSSLWTIEKRHQQELLHDKILETCVDVKRRGQMRLRFLELFGSDSEDSFSVDELTTSNKDKVARWVVRKLMPYYREGRISSRPLFKFLAKHIANNLFLKNHMPNEVDVEQSVKEFFVIHSAVRSIDDVWS